MGGRWGSIWSWAWLIGICLVVAAISLIGTSGQQGRALAAGNASPNGALALRLWLQQLGYQIKVPANDSYTMAAPRLATVLVLASGAENADNPGLLSWVRHGGHLVVGADGSTGEAVLSMLGVRVVPAPPESVRIWQPALLAPTTRAVDASAAVVVAGPPGAGLAGTSYGPVLIRRTVGQGSVTVLSAPQMLDNADIALPGNRRLALNLAGPRPGPVIFDELTGGAGASGAGWLTSSSWGTALFAFIAFVALYRWLSGMRLGPPTSEWVGRRRTTAEYVTSMANLLRRGAHRQDVLCMYQEGLRRAIRAHGISDAAVGRLLAPPGPMSQRELVKRAAAIVRAQEDLERGRI